MKSLRWMILLLAALPLSAAKAPGWLGVGLTRHADASQHWLHVRNVHEGGPAARAGLQTDDIVTAWDGKRFRFRDDLDFLEHVGRVVPGQRVVFSVLRGQKRMRIAMTAIEMPAEKRQLWEKYLEYAQQQRRRADP